MYCQHTRFINLAIHANSLLIVNLLQDFSCKTTILRERSFFFSEYYWKIGNCETQFVFFRVEQNIFCSTNIFFAFRKYLTNQKGNGGCI